MARLARKAAHAPLRLLLVAALLLLAVPFALGSAGPVANAATTTGSAKTVKGTWHPWKVDDSYDADNAAFVGKIDKSKTPSVTVSRTSNLSDEVVNVSWKNFTPTSNAANWGDPDTHLPPSPLTHLYDFGNHTVYGVTVLQCRGTHPTINPDTATGTPNVPPSKQQCYEAPVESPVAQDSGQNNMVLGVTQLNGTGSVSLHVENAATNDLLRCSPTQPCSIVVVPNQGGLFNQTGTDAERQSTSECDNHDFDIFQSPNFSDPYLADRFADFSPCAWAKRIVVPLHFAPLGSTCPDTNPSFSAAGSPPLRRALNQLLAGWCRGANAVNFDYNFSNSESTSRNRFLTSASTGLSSDTDVALTSQPADPSLAGLRRFVYAPIANDAVSIPYEIDNLKTGAPITDLRLSARLVAKLLTQSYSPLQWDCGLQEQQTANHKAPWCAKDIRGNPTSIFDDKEFQLLNFRGDHPDRTYFPSVTSTGSQQGQGSFFPTVAGGDSDSTYALTRWIAKDPAAANFLRGRPDESGMRINPHYVVPGGLYPTTSLTALDPGYTAPNIPYGGAPKVNNLDLRAKQGFQGSWNPVGSPSQVITNLSGNRSSATSVNGICPTVTPEPDCSLIRGQASITVNFPKLVPEFTGVRDLTAITDNTDSQSSGLPTAQLLTAQGTYVGPTRTALARAAAALHTNSDGVTQSLDYDSAPGAAYPLILPVYAMVPTCGISPTKVTGIKRMLDHVVGSQTYGEVPGTLMPGLVRLTSAQLANTRRAAELASSGPCPAGKSGGSGPVVDRGGAKGGGTGAIAPPTANPKQAAVAPSPAAPSSSPNPAARAQNVGYRSSDDGGALALLPILLLLGGLILIGGPLAWWGAGTGPGQVAVAKARHLAREGTTDLRNLLPSRWRS